MAVTVCGVYMVVAGGDVEVDFVVAIVVEEECVDGGIRGKESLGDRWEKGILDMKSVTLFCC